MACDFVSPENIDRCERLTQEFRDQNQSVVWKEDVLQLRTMMWFAWLSCQRQRERLEEKTRNDVIMAHSEPALHEEVSTKDTSSSPLTPLQTDHEPDHFQ